MPSNLPRPLNSPATRQSGLSLLEILIGITIVSILAALLFPVLGSLRESAHTATCLNNLRQNGRLILTMAQDDNNIIMNSRGGSGWGSGNWPQRLLDRGYVTEEERGTYFCPALEPRSLNAALKLGNLTWRVVTYGSNQTWGGGSNPPQGFGWESYPNNDLHPTWGQGVQKIYLNRLDFPSRTWILADSINIQGNPPYRQDTRIRPRGNSGNGHLHLRHGGTANMLFADGHARGVDPDELRRYRQYNYQGFRNGYRIEEYVDGNLERVSVP